MKWMILVMMLAVGCGGAEVELEQSANEAMLAVPVGPVCIPEFLRYCQPATSRCWDVCTCVNTEEPCR